MAWFCWYNHHAVAASIVCPVPEAPLTMTGLMEASVFLMTYSLLSFPTAVGNATVNAATALQRAHLTPAGNVTAAEYADTASTPADPEYPELPEYPE